MSGPPGPVPPRPPEPPTRPLTAPAVPQEALPAQPPPPVVAVGPPWWEDTWATVLVGVIGLIVGGLLGALIAGSGGTNRTVTEAQQANAQTVTSTVTNTTTAPSKVVVHTRTVTVTSEAKTPPPAPAEGAGEGGARSYTGSGAKSLGALNVERESILEWTNDGSTFSVATGEGTPVNSQAHSGSIALQPGSYSKLEVTSDGNWTIKIRPKR